MPYPAFVRARLLRPLGMRSASFTADEAITHPVALPHFVHEGTSHLLRGVGWQPGWELLPNDLAAGGLAASATQIAAWGRFQLTGTAPDGTRLLSDESLERLHTPVVRIDGEEEIALDWFVRRPGPGEHVTWSHGGVTVGYCSDLTVTPTNEVAVATLTNATNGSWVHDAMRRWVLAEAAGIDERDPEPDPSLTVDVDRLAGRYLAAFCLLDVVAGEQPGTFVVTPLERDDVTDGWLPPVEGPVTFAFTGPEDAVSLDDGPKRVARVDTTGDRAQWLTWGSRRAIRRG
jgi:CubicO group peptidase (beta-lactamase class C family)